MSNVLHFPSQVVPSSDAEARETALNTDTSCIVEAPAGSGKTGLLMQRYLKLLAHPLTEKPEEILAITFTNKATAELRDRITHQLASAASNIPLPPNASPFDQQTRAFATAALQHDTARGWNILHRPESLNIRTIDSVCAEVASALPLLSGSGAIRTPTTDANPLYHLAAQRTLLELGGKNQALHQALRTVLLHRDASLSNVEDLLAGMLAQRDQWAELVPLDSDTLDDTTLDNEVRPKLERALEDIVCAALTRATNAMPAGLLAELTKLGARLGLEPGYNGGTSPIAICANKHLPPEPAAEHLDHWIAVLSILLKPKDGGWRASYNKNFIGFEIQKADAAYLKQLVDSIQTDALQEALSAVFALPPTKYPDDQWTVVKALFLVLRRALAELKVIFAERSECDFIEIALAAHQALSFEEETSPDLALSSGGTLRHLLVDEMQDTSAGQYELIHQLTRSWDGATQTLFLVGDPKQSIYLFRQARVERFLRTMRDGRLGDIHLQALRLTSNFRSQANLVRAFNDTFKLLFSTPTKTHTNITDVEFIAATATRDASATRNIEWHAAVLGETPFAKLGLVATGNDGFDHDAAQGREIRRIVEHWVKAPFPSDRKLRPDGTPEPWKIAVLARARKHLQAVVAEFKSGTPIPYRAIDIDPLNERPEVFDALALTRALLHPADRTAWLAILHAPWCGLGLADLLTLTGEGPTADPQALVSTLIETRAPLLSSDGQQLLARTWPILQSALSTLGQTSFNIHVERTWRSLGGDLALTPAQRTNVVRYFTVLRELIADLGHLDLAALTSRLEKLYAEPATGDVAVELLTIHKAKGLEWDVVLVPSLERGSPNSFGDLLSWLEIDSTDARSSGVILAPIGSKGSETDPLNKWLNAAKTARENAERKRLFYVLSTRAREEVHLFAACARKKSDDSLAQPRHGSLLKTIWPAAEAAFGPLQTPPAKRQPMLVAAPEPESFAMAAAAEPIPPTETVQPPILHRLPLTYSPTTRFETAEASRLPYTPASALPHAPTFDRPEGSFAVRAFGNVVHRYLQVLANRLEHTSNPTALAAELPTWLPRLTATLRAEGLPPTALESLAPRALLALEHALADPEGLWILSPHPGAYSEHPLITPTGELRVDRTFLAGPTPLSQGNTHLWIVDFKTAEQGSRSDAHFRQQETAKYGPQLAAYARAALELPTPPLTIMLGLYYPIPQKFICWTFTPQIL